LENAYAWEDLWTTLTLEAKQLIQGSELLFGQIRYFLVVKNKPGKDKKLTVVPLIEENLQKGVAARILIRRFPVLKIDAQNIKNYEANCQKYDYRKKRT